MIVHLCFQARVCLISTLVDCCILIHWFTKHGELYILAKSVDHVECPETLAYVRTRVRESGYRLTPHSNSTSATYISHPDLRHLPNAIADLVAIKQPLILAGVRDAFAANAKDINLISL